MKWSNVDIRNVPIIQGPGPGNPLGRLKFMFPNHHDVYMHDTPDKHLFESSERIFSHGCIRVRNPERLAEVLLGETKGWSAADVGRQLNVKTTARFDLEQPIPVHNTYFTIWVDPDGTVAQFADVYGHDKRYSEALAGKSIEMIAARDPALALKKKNDELREVNRCHLIEATTEGGEPAGGAEQNVVWLGTMEDDSWILAGNDFPLVPIVSANRAKMVPEISVGTRAIRIAVRCFTGSMTSQPGPSLFCLRLSLSASIGSAQFSFGPSSGPSSEAKMA